MTIDIISSLACQFSCPEYLLSQYDRIPQKAITLDCTILAGIHLYNLCDLLASKERIWWLVVLKNIFFKFFLSRAKKCEIWRKNLFRFSVLCSLC